jgi:hypothetical protein
VDWIENPLSAKIYPKSGKWWIPETPIIIIE